MLCSVCNDDMLIFEYNNVKIDRCPQNHGHWFDNGELQQILSSAEGESAVDVLSDLFREEKP